MANPKVSVIMTTYGHEQYIREAIEGVLMQIVDFQVELIIANDCSPDGTDQIVREIMQEHPNGHWIKNVLQAENLGMIGNSIDAFNHAKGKYMAFCEGDDYWTDPLKLQKQVDFLDCNQDYGLVCTNYNTTIAPSIDTDSSDIYLKDILLASSIGTLTALFRIEFIPMFKTVLSQKEYIMGDYQLWILIASHARIHKLGEVTAFYRVLKESASGRTDLIKKKRFALDVIDITNKYVDKLENPIDREEIVRERYGYLFKILTGSKGKDFLKYQVEYFKKIEKIKMIDLKILFAGLIKVYL